MYKSNFLSYREFLGLDRPEKEYNYLGSPALASSGGGGGGGGNTNLIQVGGVGITLGQKTMSASLPIVIASDQAAVPVTISGNQAVNLAQVAGTTTSVNSGNKDAGTQRVVIATDQPAIPITGSITASNPSVGTNAASAPTSSTQIGWSDGSGNLQPVSASNPLPISGSISATNPSVSATGSAIPSSATMIGASDGTNLRQLLTESSSDFNLRATLYSSSTKLIGQKAMTGSLPVVLASDQASIPVAATLQAGSALAGKFSIDQTTPGTTNAVAIQDGAGNALTSNSTATSGKHGLDINVLSILGTAPTTAGFLDIKGADGNVFVRQATAANLNATVVGTGTFATQNTTQKNASPASTTMQNAATGSGNGTNLAVDGFSTAIVSITASVAMSGGTTINFEASTDNTTFVSVQAINVGTNTIATTTQTTGDWQVDVTGYSFLRARISAYSAGTITIKGWPIALTGNSKVVNVNIISSITNQSVNVAQLAGTTTSVNSGNKDAGTLRVVIATDQPTLSNPLAVSQSGTWTVGLSAGSNLIGKVSIDQTTPGTTNAVAIQDGAGNALTSNSSTFTAKKALDVNILGSLGTAFSTAGKVDVKAADGDVFVRSNAASTFPTQATLQTQTDTVMVGGVNIKEINAVTPLMGNGATGTGSQRVTIANDNTGIANWGQGATGSAVPSGAQYRGGIAKTSLPSAATDGNLTGTMLDKFGRAVVLNATIRDLMGTQTTTISNTTSETTIVTAGASGVFNDLIMLIVSNTSASSNTRIDFRDTTSGTILFSLQSNGGQPPVGFALSSPIPQTSAATNWTAQCSAATTDIRVYAVFALNK